MPSNYDQLFARTTARTQTQAARIMLSDIELFIACLNLAYREGRTILNSGLARPINKLRLGRYQLLHNSNGAVEQNHIWYEPEYQEETSLKSLKENHADLKIFLRKFSTHLQRCLFRDIIESSIRQYSAALNMRDPQLCLIRLWAALEILMQTERGNAQMTARRAAFFSKNYRYRYTKLLHIAEVRNRYVHAGTGINLADKLVEDLRTYLFALIRGMTFSFKKSVNKEQLAQILDMPADQALLRERIKLGQLGLKFRD